MWNLYFISIIFFKSSTSPSFVNKNAALLPLNNFVGLGCETTFAPQFLNSDIFISIFF